MCNLLLCLGDKVSLYSSTVSSSYAPPVSSSGLIPELWAWWTYSTEDWELWSPTYDILSTYLFVDNFTHAYNVYWLLLPPSFKKISCFYLCLIPLLLSSNLLTHMSFLLLCDPLGLNRLTSVLLGATQPWQDWTHSSCACFYWVCTRMALSTICPCISTHYIVITLARHNQSSLKDVWMSEDIPWGRLLHCTMWVPGTGQRLSALAASTFTTKPFHQSLKFFCIR